MSKQLLIERNEVDHIWQERNVLSRLKHPFLINLHYAYQTEQHIYYLLDFVNGGDLFGYLQEQENKRFSEDSVRFYAAQLLILLEYLHTNNVIYRDIKPDHMLLNRKGYMVACDFGFAKIFNSSEDRTESFVGTPEYIAPEILRGDKYSFSVDYWAFGVLVYELAAGLPPFFAQSVPDLYEQVLMAQLQFPEHFSPELKKILQASY